jgi:hypothetical protein
MTKAIVQRLGLAAMASALVLGAGSSPSLAHNDWGLPLLGGLVGGYGLSTMMQHKQQEERAQPVYVAPTPVYAAPAAPVAPAAPSAAATASSIEHQLNVLDDLAAKGYITKSEYDARRQALLNQL